MPLRRGSRNSDHGLPCVNTEYVSFNVMFDDLPDDGEGGAKMTADQAALYNAAIGLSIVEVKREGGVWRVVQDSPLNRRITMDSEMTIAGPLAGHPPMRTSCDPEGRTARGTNHSCGGGVTPWGTVLSCEEGAGDTFGGDRARSPHAAVPERQGCDGSDYHGRARFDDRFATERACDQASGRDLLDAGTLSVARFNADGSVDWLPLVHGTGPLTAENGFADQADALLETRLAADAVGATPMDRPEDTEANPVTGRVYALMTKNKKITADKLNPVSTRPESHDGHIAEPIPPGGAGAAADHAADRFEWDIFVLCGKPKAPGHGARFHEGTSEDGRFVNPDNLTFDPRGREFVATDGANDFNLPDGISGVDTEGPARGLPRLLFSAPTGAECCGPCVTPDGTTLLVSVQHPVEDSETPATATTRWPDFAEGGVPHPAVVAIQRADGGEVAARRQGCGPCPRGDILRAGRPRPREPLPWTSSTQPTAAS